MKRGQVLAAPGSIATAMSFEAEIYVLTQDEGGRHTPFFTNYRPQFFIRTADITGSIDLPEVRPNPPYPNPTLNTNSNPAYS